jgi:hypothetical protein
MAFRQAYPYSLALFGPHPALSRWERESRLGGLVRVVTGGKDPLGSAPSAAIAFNALRWQRPATLSMVIWSLLSPEYPSCLDSALGSDQREAILYPL